MKFNCGLRERDKQPPSVACTIGKSPRYTIDMLEVEQSTRWHTQSRSCLLSVAVIIACAIVVIR